MIIESEIKKQINRELDEICVFKHNTTEILNKNKGLISLINSTKYKKSLLFGNKGLCLKISIHNPKNNRKAEIFIMKNYVRFFVFIEKDVKMILGSSLDLIQYMESI